MNWKKGNKPNKDFSTNLYDSSRYLVRYRNNLMAINRFFNNRWLKSDCKGNHITHYCKIKELEEK